MLAAEAAMAGRRILEAAPTADQTGAFWASVKAYFAEPITAGVVYKNETDRTLELPGGGRIRCKTAHDADTLRGDYADLLILDEYEMMNPNAWNEVGAPMLLDNDGDAVFIGTPMRKNHFFQAYARSLGDVTGRWAVWHFTSHDNPYLPKVALAEITQDMTEEAYRQEIMAEFLENAGAVFRRVKDCMTAPLSPALKDHEGHHKVMGLDWGKHHDFTTASVGCTTCKQEIARDRFNKIDYVFQRDRIKALWKLWHVSFILAEKNSMGEPNIEMMQRDGLPVAGFDTTATSKPPLIENMALVFERKEWQFQDDPIWTAEAEAYERKVSPVTGRSQYSAPEGMNDDTVIGRALMLQAAKAPPMPKEQPAQKSKWTDGERAGWTKKY
jgi:hypothetical protein